MAIPTFSDLSIIRSFIDAGKIRVSKASRRRIFATEVVGVIFQGKNGYGDDCYDLISASNRYTGKVAAPCWRVYLAPLARVTPRGHHWKIETARAPQASCEIALWEGAR